ncbi:hypothetical protein SD70_12470 [Gordoniibacillus kamchatkensis]|uniref:AraC-type arabinose-binding/dimerisation domain-containing protein n=1 Tax=Gordoniibacillus kamchatkensis TaxID=1590651 RepID=A0ABR5AHR5_9BACL|nr:hypothetical protein SD70_12470 [Paenibacillus sp. VKM B-2647]
MKAAVNNGAEVDAAMCISSDKRNVHIGELGTLRPTVNFANYFTAPAGYVWGPRAIPDYQFVYIVEGEASFEFAGQTLELRPGHCIFYGPHTPHRLAASPRGPLTLSSVHFSWDAESAAPVSPVSHIRECSQQELLKPTPAYTVHAEGAGDVELWPFYDVQGLEGHLCAWRANFCIRKPVSSSSCAAICCSWSERSSGFSATSGFAPSASAAKSPPP